MLKFAAQMSKFAAHMSKFVAQMSPMVFAAQKMHRKDWKIERRMIKPRCFGNNNNSCLDWKIQLPSVYHIIYHIFLFFSLFTFRHKFQRNCVSRSKDVSFPSKLGFPNTTLQACHVHHLDAQKNDQKVMAITCQPKISDIQIYFQSLYP